MNIVILTLILNSSSISHFHDSLLHTFSISLSPSLSSSRSRPRPRSPSLPFLFLKYAHNLQIIQPLKLIKSRAVWENMARMSIKSQRLDVALLCFGNMGDANALQAYRDTANESDPKVKMAALATHLGKSFVSCFMKQKLPLISP